MHYPGGFERYGIDRCAMNILFTDCMTVYNYHRDKDTGEESWRRTVIRGIQWRHGKKGIAITAGEVTAGNVESITIDCEHEYGNKPYVDVATYSRLPELERTDYWTLNDLEGQDVLVCGVVEQEINEEYRIKNLLLDHTYAGIVVSISDNRNRPRLKHMRVEVKR